MNRADKIEAVKQMNEAFQQTPYLILASFRGLSVNQATDLRRKIRAAGGSYRVIQNRLAQRAAEGTAVARLTERFSGPCAIASHDTDPVALAKALGEFAKDHPQVRLLAGIVDAKELLDSEGLKALGQLPGLPELRAQLLSLLLNPATALVRLLNTPGTQIARAMEARRESQEGDAES